MAAKKTSHDFRIVLDPTGGVPFYRQIIMQVQMAVADGRIGPGTQLPTVRGLAVELQINPNTVARAYNELEIRGVVATQQGTGTFISDRPVELRPEERELVLRRLTESFLASANGYGISADELIEALKRAKEGRNAT